MGKPRDKGSGAIRQPKYRDLFRLLNTLCFCPSAAPPCPTLRLYIPSTSEMLDGPHPQMPASSYLFRDAMERRGRSRAIPTTAAIRKNHHHQRQLYYSHYPTNPRSPSPSPVSSPEYVSSSTPYAWINTNFRPPRQLARLDFPAVHHA